MNSKGQITIEYLIILSIMMLLFSAVSMDLISASLENTMQVQTGEIIRQVNSTFQNKISELLLQASGSKTTVKISSSADCDFIVNSSNLVLNCSPETASFKEYNGTLIAQAPPGYDYNCLTCGGRPITNEELQIIQITKQ